MFKIADQLVTLRRNEKTILFNANQVNPIFIEKGEKEIFAFIENFRKEDIVKYIFNDNESLSMFNFLQDHHIIIQSNDNDNNSPGHNCTYECNKNKKAEQRSLYLLVSQDCNQGCIYCLNGKESYRNNHPSLMMDEKTCYQAIRTVLDQITDDGKLDLVFFGGEPLLNWDLVKKAILYCETTLKEQYTNKTFHYHLTTNLTIFPDDLIKYVKKYNISFLVDIDGPEEIHNFQRPFVDGRGSFKTSVNNIKQLIDEGIDVSLRATITSHNHNCLPDIARTHKDIGGSGCAFVPLNVVDSDGTVFPETLCPTPKMLKQGLLEVYNSGLWPVEKLFPFNEYQQRLTPGYHNKWGCGAPFGNTPVITVDGKIFSCIYLVENKAYEVGDIWANDFPRRDVIQYMLDTIHIDDRQGCQNCGYRNLCGGGCPVGLYAIENNPEASDFIKRYTKTIACTVSKTVIEALMWDIGNNIFNTKK